MTIKLTINNFKSLEDFAKLQQNFSCEDYNYKMYSEVFSKPKLELIKEDFYISCQVADEFSDDGKLISTKIEHLYFFKDFLNKRLQYLSEDFIWEFHNEIRKQLIDNPQIRKRIVYGKRIEFDAIYKNIKQFSFLPLNLYNTLLNQIELIRGAINSDELENDKTYAIGKIKLKDYNVTDLAVLFNHLRAEKFIHHHSDVDLGRLLENFFCSEKEGELVGLNGMGKNINNLKNGNKGNDKSKERIYQLFKNINN